MEGDRQHGTSMEEAMDAGGPSEAGPNAAFATSKRLSRSITPRLEDRKKLQKIVHTYTWGPGDLGQLGLGDTDDRSTPALVEKLEDKQVVHAAASDYHTAFVTADGELYTCGSNDSGQLGVKGREAQTLPTRVAALDLYTIVHVACGQGHTVAVTDQGALASWGAAEFGQLGQKEAAGSVDVPQPRIIKGTRELRFARVAAGAAHTLALTGSGEVYSFGHGLFGALGHANTEDRSTPCLVGALWGLPVVQVACGENHSVALTIEGEVFTWGRGKYGQLGHGDSKNESLPKRIEGLSAKGVAQVACGGDHTLAISRQGGLYTWGRGRWGQTGHGLTDDLLSPKLVKGLGEQRVLQVSGGTRHSLAVVDGGAVYGWGDGEQGQLGAMAAEDSKVLLEPALLQGLPEGRRLLFVTAGGEHNIAVLEAGDLSGISEDAAGVPTTADLMDTDAAPVSSQPPGELPVGVSLFAQVKRDESRAAGRGLLPLALPPLMDLIEEATETKKASAALHACLEDVFSSAGLLSYGFRVGQTVTQEPASTSNRSEGHSGEGLELDIWSVKKVYQSLLALLLPEVVEKLGAALVRLLDALEERSSHTPSKRWAKVLLILLQAPLVGEKGLGDVVSTRLFALFARLSESLQAKFVGWLRCYPKEIFSGRFIRGAHRYITNRQHVIASENIPAPDLAAAVKVLELLHRANQGDQLVEYTAFYSTAISQHASFREEYLRWLHWREKGSGRDSTTLISYCQVPFVLNPEAKARTLQGEAKLQMSQMVQDTQMRFFFQGGQLNPFLILAVRRNNLVQDALQQLASHALELKKPLKVVFAGEEGVDQGGVTKEFFQLLVRDLFNVGFGMFTYDDDTRTFWFNRNSMESELEFQLVGVILGLAIYNGVNLDVHFPMVVYKKLMRQPLDLHDLEEVQPQMMRSLQQLLDFEGDVEAIFCLTFQVEYEFFGEMRTFDLVPDGANVPVSSSNRRSYVEKYVKYLLEDSIETQFAAFQRGFLQVCGGPALTLFRFEELELLVCGLPHFDFDALERVAVYEGGFSRDSQVVRWFWEVVHAMTLEDKKKLLFFTTGSDRAPIGGLATLRFVVQKMGPNSDRLPTSHTCFNVLLLPEYDSKGKLKERLYLAIKNAVGFGLQ